MEINRENVIEIINKSGLKPDKDYGQNFLLDPNISKRIVELLEINNNDEVLEVGGGIGSLTHFLTLTDGNISVVDIDERMISFLKIIYKNNAKLILNDIRKESIEKYTKIIGNLPYNITTEAVTYLLENGKNAQKMVLMCQAEAFNRFNDLSGKEFLEAFLLLIMY